MEPFELLRAQAVFAGQGGKARLDIVAFTNQGLRLLCLCGLLLLCGNGWSQTVLRVGIEPAHTSDGLTGNDELIGLYLGVLEAVAEQQQWQLVVQTGSQPQLLEQLDRGELDLLAGIAITAELAASYDVTEHSVLFNWTQLLSAGHPIHSLPDLEGIRIAGLADDGLLAELDRRLQALDIKAQLLETDNYHQAIAWVLEAKAEAVVIPRSLLQQVLASYSLQLTPVICCDNPVGYLAKREQFRLGLAAIDAYLKQQQAQPGSDYHRSLKRILGRAPEQQSQVWLLAGMVLLLCVLLLGGFWLRIQVRQRTARLQLATEEMAQRLQRRTDELSKTNTVLEREVLHHRATQQQLRHLARHDPLTGLPNRRYFSELMEQELKRAHRTGRTLVVMSLDLDGFKQINDLQGHDAGDQLLVECAARLRRTLRDVDLIARLGGDEFVVLLSEINTVQDAALVAQKIIEVIGQPLPQMVQTLGVSIGYSYFPEHGYEVEQLLSKADKAMSCAKQQGKNGFVDFENLQQ